MIDLKKLHNSLVRWRLPHIAVMVIFIFIALDAWAFYKVNFKLLELNGSVGFMAIAGLVFGVITACLNYINGKYERDDHD